MVGGGGNDTYVVDSAGDVVTELSTDGRHRHRAEQRQLHAWRQRREPDPDRVGQHRRHRQYRRQHADRQCRQQRPDGGAGNDTMVGGAGNDTYVVDATGDVVTEQAGAGHRYGPEQRQLHARRQCREPHPDGHRAINATGNTLDNTLTGNTGANILDGGAGNDTMVGGAGNDTYVVDAAGDVVTEFSRRGHRHGAEQHQLHARRQRREPDADRHRQHQRHRQCARQHADRQCRQQHPGRRRRQRHDGWVAPATTPMWSTDRRRGDRSGRSGHRHGAEQRQLHARRQRREPDADRAPATSTPPATPSTTRSPAMSATTSSTAAPATTPWPAAPATTPMWSTRPATW